MIASLFTLPLRMLVVAAALPIPSALGATVAVAAPVPNYGTVAESVATASALSRHFPSAPLEIPTSR